MGYTCLADAALVIMIVTLIYYWFTEEKFN